MEQVLKAQNELCELCGADMFPVTMLASGILRDCFKCRVCGNVKESY